MSLPATWFITGTDTDAGKTCVARALLSAARVSGLKAVGYKPIESGCSPKQEFGADAMGLAEAAGTVPHCSYVFAAPVAPLHAAEQEGVSINMAPILAKAKALQAEADLLLIEGAGGLLVPLAKGTTMADLAVELKQPVLIVAPDALGSINHSLLTIEAARNRGLRVDALILSESEAGAGQGLANAAQIREYGQIEVLQLKYAKTSEALEKAGSALLESLLALE